MATYKVLQDIEAEDKLIGPLTFRQFVYAGACVLLLYLSFLVITKGAAPVAAIFLPMAAICAFFAWPFAGEQPTEVWALAKIRFMVKPRKRIWDQSGVKELVTITVPKKIEKNFTNGLSQTEVKSRLKVLADTIDSRGWAIKNVNVNMYSQPALIMNEPDSDRLINIESMPQNVPNLDIRASDDMLDERNNPIAQQFDTMIAASTKAHRQQIIDRLRQSAAASTQPPAAAPTAVAAVPMLPIGTGNAPRPAGGLQGSGARPGGAAAPPANNNYWFLSPSRPSVSSPQDAVTFNAQVVAPGTPAASEPVQPGTPTPDEEELLRQLAAQNNTNIDTYSHLHTIKPLSVQAEEARRAAAEAQAKAAAEAQAKMTRRSDAAILDLAGNDDLNVATIAREAHKRTEPPQDEVVISLH